MKFQILMPHQNLGCFAIRIGRFYIDFFRTPYWGTFATNGKGKAIRIRLFPFRFTANRAYTDSL